MWKLLFVFLAIVLIGCLGQTDTSLNQPVVLAPEENTDNFCSIDVDCVAKECCHARTAINFQFAPDCLSVMCTEECARNTLDCGQGVIRCISDRCVVSITDPLPLPTPTPEVNNSTEL